MAGNTFSAAPVTTGSAERSISKTKIIKEKIMIIVLIMNYVHWGPSCAINEITVHRDTERASSWCYTGISTGGNHL